MNSDSWRLHYTYGIAILVLLAVFGLVFLKINEISAETLIAFVAGVASSALLFVFNRESSAGASRATERAVDQGANAGVKPPESTP